MTNLGVKRVRCMMSDGTVKPIDFQVGDKITRGLLAVSQLAQSGAGVWFGPAPNYESLVVWDKTAHVASNKLKLPIKLVNGTYQMGLVEVSGTSGALLPQSAPPLMAGADSPDVDPGAGTPIPAQAGTESPRPEEVDAPMPGQLRDSDWVNQMPER